MAIGSKMCNFVQFDFSLGARLGVWPKVHLCKLEKSAGTQKAKQRVVKVIESSAVLVERENLTAEFN